LISISIPENVTSIGSRTFSGCTALSTVFISNSVNNINDAAFQNCVSLISVNIPNGVTTIGNQVFSGCSSLTSINIPESVTSIGTAAFDGCKLRNVLIKCSTPPIAMMDSFSDQTYYHTTLYVPTDCWDAYAYDDNWYKFHNIRETATEEELLSSQLAYTLMDANTFTYSVYDPVNDCIGIISSVGINEDNPNHCWQVINANGSRCLYNVGAKKFLKSSSNGAYELSDIVTPIKMENGEKGIVIGAQNTKQWAFINNERMNTEQAVITRLDNIPTNLQKERSYFDIQGRKQNTPQKGVNIIRKSNGTTRKVLIK
jgi:hypothetical protein